MTKRASEMNLKELATYIDYSVLKPELTPQQIREFTQDGVSLGCATICINPSYIDICKPYVENTNTKLCPVIDFPFGTSSLESKMKQIDIVARYDAVSEIDLVANFGLIRAGLYDEVYKELKNCADWAHKFGKKIKVILETDVLTDEQIKSACQCCIKANVDFIKTSTGFLAEFEQRGLTLETLKLIMKEIGNKCTIKGNGYIRTHRQFLELIDMGIHRMGVGYKSVPVVLGLN